MQVAGVPAQELSVDTGIIDRHVLTFPEGVLGIEVGIPDLDIPRPLEGIVALQLQAVDFQPAAVHEDIVRTQGAHVLQHAVAAVPASLRSTVDQYAAQGHPIHFAEGLGRIDDAVLHQQVP